MAFVNKQIVDAANKTYSTLFDDVLAEDTGNELLRLATVVDSTVKVEEYDWFQDFVEMRLWEGERKLSDAKAYSHTIRNRKHEATFAVDREDMDYDRLGRYEPQVEDLANSYRRKVRKDLAQLILEGDSREGYDGVPFFSDSHPNDSGPDQSNQIDSVAGSGEPFTGEDIDAAVEQMMLLKDDAGRTLDLQPDTIVVGPKRRATVRQLFELRTTPEGGENEYFGMIDNVIVDSSLGTDEDAYLFDTSRSVLPFIWQEHTGPEFAALTDPNSQHVFFKDEYVYGTRAIWGVGYGLWQMATRIIAS